MTKSTPREQVGHKVDQTKMPGRATGMHRQPLATLQRKDKPGQTPNTSQRHHQRAAQKEFFAPLQKKKFFSPPRTTQTQHTTAQRNTGQNHSAPQ
jgi:hypothetical protein